MDQTNILDEVPISQRIETLSKQIASSPQDYSLLKDRSELYFDSGSPELAIKDIQQALVLFRENPELHYLRGFYAFNLGDTLTAIEALETSIGLGNPSAKAYYLLGQLHFFGGNYPDARREYLLAQQRDSDEPQYTFALGLLDEKQNNPSGALEYYKMCLDTDSTFLRAYIRLHDVYLDRYYNESIANGYIEKLLAINPGHAQGRFRKGNYYMRKLIRLPASSNDLAVQNIINEAVNNFTLSIRKDTTFTQGYYNRGFCYFLGEQYEEAMRDFRKVIKLEPQNPQGHFMLGSLYEGFDDQRSAMNHYLKALEYKPDFTEAKEAIEEIKNP